PPPRPPRSRASRGPQRGGTSQPPPLSSLRCQPVGTDIVQLGFGRGVRHRSGVRLGRGLLPAEIYKVGADPAARLVRQSGLGRGAGHGRPPTRMDTAEQRTGARLGASTVRTPRAIAVLSLPAVRLPASRGSTWWSVGPAITITSA